MFNLKRYKIKIIGKASLNSNERLEELWTRFHIRRSPYRVLFTLLKKNINFHKFYIILLVINLRIIL